MPRRKLLAVDLDGTLLDARGAPHARDLASLRAALEAGVHVSILTGRLYSGTRAVARSIGIRGPVGCADGSHVVRAETHATLLHLAMSPEAVVRLRGVMAREGLATFVFADDAIGHDGRGEPFVRYVSTWSTDVRPTSDVFDHALWGAPAGVTAAVGLGPRERVGRAVDDFSRGLAGAVFCVSFPVSRPDHADLWAVLVRASGCTKGSALQWIAEHEGVALEDTVCVGDWLNDEPMFEVAGRSFAMGQAPAALKARATDVLDETSATGGGIARVVERAFGIRVP